MVGVLENSLWSLRRGTWRRMNSRRDIDVCHFVDGGINRYSSARRWCWQGVRKFVVLCLWQIADVRELWKSSEGDRSLAGKVFILDGEIFSFALRLIRVTWCRCEAEWQMSKTLLGVQVRRKSVDEHHVLSPKEVGQGLVLKCCHTV